MQPGPPALGLDAPASCSQRSPARIPAYPEPPEAREIPGPPESQAALPAPCPRPSSEAVTPRFGGRGQRIVAAVSVVSSGLLSVPLLLYLNPGFNEKNKITRASGIPNDVKI